MALVDAIWTGPFPAEVGDRLLQPGDEAQVTERDLESTHWTRKTKPRKQAHTPESEVNDG